MALYLIFYSINLYKWFLKKRNFDYIIRKFEKFMKDDFKQKTNKTYNYEDEQKHQNQLSNSILKNFLHEMPLINSLLIYNWESFSLHDSPIKTIYTFEDFYDQLIKEYNEFIFRKKRFLSPVQPLLQIFLLPSKILSWFGLTFSDVKSRVISGVTIIFGVVLKFYGKDIIDWLLSLFR